MKRLRIPNIRAAISPILNKGMAVYRQLRYNFLERLISTETAKPAMGSVSDLWSRKATPEDWAKRKLVAWEVYPYIERQHVNRMVSGDPDINWFRYLKNKYIPDALDYGLDLGCGSGVLDGLCLKHGLCKRMDAFDIATGAIEIARKNAASAHLNELINYEVRDINEIRLERNKYDIVFTPSSAHHFRELDHIFTEIHSSLKDKGIFVLVEFVGPSQFQWTEKQLQIINDLLNILPENYRNNINIPGTIKERVVRPSVADMNAYDPSEAIRSADIIPMVDKYFNIIEKRDYGGTVLHMLLNDIVGNFDEKKEQDIAFIKLLCYFEKTLIQEKVLPSDFAFIIATRR